MSLPTHIAHQPAVAPESRHPSALASRGSTAAPKLTGLRGVRVLAVDDEPEARNVLRAILESAGADVEMASSGAEVLERLVTRRPDVLIADVGMPGMDGFDLIEQVRAFQDVDVRDVPAAALTAYARPEDRTHALHSGFEMHLAKPVDPAELVASVATLARRRRR